ncbi:MAG: DUF3696 domain-containing protein [Chloroflexi bacterium]|nr:DUF3696 domain-containing protein [Chloroflexota bacterium]
MLTELRLQNFKSWEDTGPIRLASISGFFGSNSSGKTSLLQALLLLKQTAESTDRSRVLHLGDERAYVDLGTLPDVIFAHQLPATMTFDLSWGLSKSLRILDPEGSATLFRIDGFDFHAALAGDSKGLQVEEFTTRFSSEGEERRFGMTRRTANVNGSQARSEYEIVAEGYELKRNRGRLWALPAPVKFYGFPDQVNAYYQNAGFLSELSLALEEALQGIYYLGPLREYPHRIYGWAGEQPVDVGRRGELAIPALLAGERKGRIISRGRGRLKQTATERVTQWLRDLGLIHSFSVRPIAENRKEYEVRVKRSATSTEVALTDVGFGVSQILPVLTLCYYAPEGSTLILEQPEIHLHPSVQAGLADVFIDAVKTRKIQIILESHSEHLLRRIQRRIAEEKLDSQQSALYFVTTDEGRSLIDRLEIDLFGNVTNWPENFFGDELGELVAMTDAAMARQMKGS